MAYKPIPGIPNPYRGIYVAFEGIDGCGKTKQMELAEKWIRSVRVGARFPVAVSTKEPNKSLAFGSAIYKDLGGQGANLNQLCPIDFQKWYACDSKENMRDNVIPNLKVGNVVLTDRCRASMVYGAKDLEDLEKLVLMNQFIMGDVFIWPDAVLIFDVEIETALERLKAKGRNLDAHEKSQVLARVQANYRLFAANYANCHLINGEGNPEEVFERVKPLLRPVVSRYRPSV